MNHRLGSIMDNEENMAPSTFALFVYIDMVMLVMILHSWGHQGTAGGSSSMVLVMAVSRQGISMPPITLFKCESTMERYLMLVEQVVVVAVVG